MEKFFERNPLQVFTVINMVVLGLSVIVLAVKVTNKCHNRQNLER